MVRTLLYEQQAFKQLCHELRLSKEFAIASALISSAGIDLVISPLIHCLQHGAKGKILAGIDLPTDPKAIEKLLSLADRFPGSLQLKYFRPLTSRIFHPKLYLFRTRSGASKPFWVPPISPAGA
jgi:HKD family nuclease